MTKNSLTDKVSKRLPELEFKTLDKIKKLKMDCQKNTAKNIKMTGKEYAKKKKNTHCLVCRKKTELEKYH